MGRPSDYKQSYCELAIELIGRNGKSITQFARDIGVSKSSVYLWATVHPEFSDALDTARDWSEAFWEDQYISFMTDKSVNAPLVKLYFANRFQWKESPEPVINPDPITINIIKPDGAD
jgi:transposase-like protein